MEKETRIKVVESLKTLVTSSKRDVKFKAILALCLIDEGRDFAIPLLINMLIDGDNRQSETAKLALIDIGEPAIPEVLKLVDNAEDEHGQIVATTILTEIILKAEEHAKMEKMRKDEQELIAKYKAQMKKEE